MDIDSKDLISSLPEDLICHILSFLPTGEAALTPLISKKWRYLFALTPNLDFHDLVINRQCEKISPNRHVRHRLFMDFVERVLLLRRTCTINKFSFECGDGDIDSARLSRLITNVIEHGLSDFDIRNLYHRGDDPIWISGSVFVSKSLVRLRIKSYCCDLINVKDIFLPNLKTLHLILQGFGNSDNCSLANLVSACHVLEELVLIIGRLGKVNQNRFVSSKTLKRLTLHCICGDIIPQSVLFDTPNLVYFEYLDHVAEMYKIANLNSLVEASVELVLTSDQRAHASHGDMVCNVTNLLMGISNVWFLHLWGDTLEVVNLCCEQVPVFKNLIYLAIKTHRKSGWESLPALLKNCPNLETLVFDGLYHNCTIECGCLCEIAGEILTCLSSSSVKFLVMSRSDGSGVANYIEQQVKQFLETMPRLEQLTIHYETWTYENMIKLSSQLKNLTKVTSQECELLEIYDKPCSSYFAYNVINLL